MGFAGEGARARQTLVVNHATLFVVVYRAFEATLCDFGGRFRLLLSGEGGVVRSGGGFALLRAFLRVWISSWLSKERDGSGCKGENYRRTLRQPFLWHPFLHRAGWRHRFLWGRFARGGVLVPSHTCMFGHEGSEDGFCTLATPDEADVGGGGEGLSAKELHVAGGEP